MEKRAEPGAMDAATGDASPPLLLLFVLAAERLALERRKPERRVGVVDRLLLLLLLPTPVLLPMPVAAAAATAGVPLLAVGEVKRVLAGTAFLPDVAP